MYERDRSWRRRAILGGAAGVGGLIIAGAIAGGYFFPRQNGESAPVATSTPSGAPGSPRPPEGRAPEVRPDSKSSREPYESLGGVPFNSNEFNGDIAPDAIMAFTGGPMTVQVRDGCGNMVTKSFSGGTDRGTVVLFVGDTKVNSVRITGLQPGSNWFGVYRPVGDRGAAASEILRDRIAAMGQDPNCLSGQGCEKVDWMVINANTKAPIAASGIEIPGQSFQNPGVTR